MEGRTEQMKVPYSYYEDEVRDGYYVPGMMKRAWAAGIEVLEAIDEVCAKYHIQYFADSGTLLGAIRHKGYIPWDDDLDIIMRREDYQRFLEVAPKEFEKDGIYCIINIHTQPDYDQLFTRVVNGMKINFSKEHMEMFHGYPFVSGIDIFVLDYIAPNEEEEEVRCEMVAIVSSAIGELRVLYESADTMDEEERRQAAILEETTIEQIEQLCKVSIDRNGNILNQLYKLMEKLYSLIPAEEATELAFMPIWTDKRSGNRFQKEWYESSMKVDFEYTKIPVPVMYNAILTAKYGNYLELVHNWDFHDYPIYNTQMIELKEKTGITFPTYEYSPEQMNKERDYGDIHQPGYDIKRYVRSNVRHILARLSEAHTEARILYEQGQYQYVQEILAECQNSIIYLGNLIEEHLGEGTRTVSAIEEYCETLYRIYISVMEEPVDMELIHHGLTNISVVSEEEFFTKKKILIIPYQFQYWNRLKPVYQHLMEDEENEVAVMPVNFYYKGPMLDIIGEYYEGEKFAKEVPIVDYGTYDIRQEQPDEIIIQSPYDEFNYIVSINPDFYASRIRNFTDKLIYIPFFTTEEVDSRDERMKWDLVNYAMMPGVVCADTVIVQSERMKDTYIEYLTNHVGEETRDIWKQKIVGNSVVNDWIWEAERETRNKYPDEWKALIHNGSGEKRKVLVYYIGISQILEEGSRYIDKIKSNFEVFLKNRDNIMVVLKTHELTETTLKYMDKKLWNQYRELMEMFDEKEIGIRVGSDVCNDILAYADAYYGDSSELIQLFRNDKKPVMIQTV